MGRIYDSSDDQNGSYEANSSDEPLGSWAPTGADDDFKEIIMGNNGMFVKSCNAQFFRHNGWYLNSGLYCTSTYDGGCGLVKHF